VWGLRCNRGFLPCSEAAPKWKEAVRRALELEPTLAEARAQAAAIRFYADWDWVAAGQELAQAVRLDPNYAEAHVWYGEWLYSVAGRAEEGIAEARRALELDPYNSLYRAFVGQALLFARRDAEAISHFKQVLQADPNTPLAPSLLQRAYERKGMYPEAMALWRQTIAAGRDQDVSSAVERGFAQGGYRGAMRARADLAVARSQREYVAPSTIATFYAIAG